MTNDDVELSTQLVRARALARRRVRERSSEFDLDADCFIGLVTPSRRVPEEQLLGLHELEGVAVVGAVLGTGAHHREASFELRGRLARRRPPRIQSEVEERSEAKCLRDLPRTAAEDVTEGVL